MGVTLKNWRGLLRIIRGGTRAIMARAQEREMSYRRIPVVSQVSWTST